MLLSETALAVAITESWRASWWLWHVLMIAAFAAIATASARMPSDERFSDLYLDDVAAGTRDVTVLFADLKGFSKFSEENPSDVVRAMLNTYFEAVLPGIRAAGGRVDRFIGDAVMVTFNVSAEQPDHAVGRHALPSISRPPLSVSPNGTRAGHGSAPESTPVPPVSEWSATADSGPTRCSGTL